jgi:flavin-dependent dehydrogenase
MKIAVVGMGVAGSYLASRLNSENQVFGFERLKEDNFDAVCGWGTTIVGISKYAKDCGLNFEDYITHTGKSMRVDVNGEIINIDLKGLCCFDKIRFIRDMSKDIDIKFGRFISKETFSDEYDLIIDSTGLIRPLLPKIENDLLIPCVQYKVRFKEPPYDDFFVKTFPNLTGYFWYFPLGDGIYHVGAGDYYKKHNEELSTFFKKFPAEILKKNGRPVRITPPSLCEPFYDGNVVGVGESIGTVYPMLGEGIIPSLQNAEILMDNLQDMASYREKVLEEFKIYSSVYRFIKSKIDGTFHLSSQFPSLWSIYRYMKKREDRYGMDIRMRNLMKIVLGA